LGSYQLHTICGAITGDYVLPSDPSRFNRPKDAAIELGTPYVYVADSDNHRVKKMTLDCTYITHWGKLGTDTYDEDKDGVIEISEVSFRSPLSVAYYSGEVYVVDTNGFVQVFDTVGNFKRKWSTPFPVSMELVSGNVYITASTGKIYKYDTNGTLLATFDTIKKPRGIAVDSGGYIYVTAGEDSTIKKLDPSGNVVASYGSYGTALGQYRLPYDVDIDNVNGYIFVADGYLNNRIQILKQDGSFLNYIPQVSMSYGALKNPSGVALADTGELVVMDTDNSRVLIFEPVP